MIKGRQSLLLIYSYFKTSVEAGALHDLTDLMSVRLNGDKLDSFLNTWDQVLIGMREEPSEETKRTLFLKQLKRVPHSLFGYDLAEYERFPVGDSKRTYDHLYGSSSGIWIANALM